MSYSVHRQEAHHVRTALTLDEKMFTQGRAMRAMYVRTLDKYPPTIDGRKRAVVDTVREYVRLQSPVIPQSNKSSERDAAKNERAFISTIALQWGRVMADAIEVHMSETIH